MSRIKCDEVFKRILQIDLFLKTMIIRTLNASGFQSNPKRTRQEYKAEISGRKCCLFDVEYIRMKEVSILKRSNGIPVPSTIIENPSQKSDPRYAMS